MGAAQDQRRTQEAGAPPGGTTEKGTPGAGPPPAGPPGSSVCGADSASNAAPAPTPAPLQGSSCAPVGSKSGPGIEDARQQPTMAASGLACSPAMTQSTLVLLPPAAILDSDGHDYPTSPGLNARLSAGFGSLVGGAYVGSSATGPLSTSSVGEGGSGGDMTDGSGALPDLDPSVRCLLRILSNITGVPLAEAGPIAVQVRHCKACMGVGVVLFLLSAPTPHGASGGALSHHSVANGVRAGGGGGAGVAPRW